MSERSEFLVARATVAYGWFEMGVLDRSCTTPSCGHIDVRKIMRLAKPATVSIF